MTTDQETQTARPGAPASLLGRDQRTSIIRLEPEAELHTHQATIARDDLIGLPWGTQVRSHLGEPPILFRPSTDDIARNLKPTTPIVYAKDAGDGFFGSIPPTANQVINLINALKNADCGLLEVKELLLRPHKIISARLTPKEGPTPRTGYLVFARKLIPSEV